ncbi:MAG: hypothetical protein GX683_04455, partial [Ruminococcaceae bacterium]|nr:hypothetical protein [Oscillospiraceae bacterium]
KLTADGDEYIYTKNELEAAAENGAGYEWLCQKNGVSTSPLFENVETAAYDLASLSLKACVAYSADADAVTFFGITEPYATLEVTVSSDEGDETCKLVFGDVYGESDIVAALNQSHSVTITDFGNVSEIVSLLKSV